MGKPMMAGIEDLETWIRGCDLSCSGGLNELVQAQTRTPETRQENHEKTGKGGVLLSIHESMRKQRERIQVLRNLPFSSVPIPHF